VGLVAGSGTTRNKFMGAWTIGSLTSPVTRGTVAPVKNPRDEIHIFQNLETWLKGRAARMNPDGTIDQKSDAPPNSDIIQSLMNQIYGNGNWQGWMGSGDRSGLVGGRGSGPTPESIYAQSASNLMNAKAYAIGQAYNQWNQNKLNYQMDQLTGSGLGMGMMSGQVSQYNSLRNQMMDQQNQQAMWNRTAASIGAAPVIPMQSAPPKQSSGWSTGFGSLGGFGFGI
jgi:hypothetical protein